MKKISILYHHFPHYRAPVMRALAQSKKYEYHFFGCLDDYAGIKAFKGDEMVHIHPIQFIHNSSGKMDIEGYEEAVSSKFDAAIIIGNPNMRGTWKAQQLARKNGLATAYWAHGWLKKEIFIKAKIRNYYFNKVDKVLTYGARAKEIAASTGFNIDKIQVIWNSLDYEAQTRLFNIYKDLSRLELRQMINMPVDKPILLTISRVTDLCHYEWLIEAVAHLKNTNKTEFEIWMIGDGPALDNLKTLANQLNVNLHVKGSLYDENEIAKHIMAADMVVSPGKLGLTGMHALAYGTPVVTHNDFDLQMPEVEAVIENESGVFFKYNDPMDLADKLLNFYAEISDYSRVRERCRTSLLGRFTPEDQVRLIDEAMDMILNDKAQL